MIKLDNPVPLRLTHFPLEDLARNPDCGNWAASILIGIRCARWPGWGLQYALSTVDKHLEICTAQFLMHPPKYWRENPDAEYPSGVTAQRIENEALPASRVVSLLNTIFGHSVVYLNGRIDTDRREKLEAAAGIKLTWRTAVPFEHLGQTLRVDLDEFSFATFYCNFSSEGPLLRQAELAARSFVNAARAQERMIGDAGQHAGAPRRAELRNTDQPIEIESR